MVHISITQTNENELPCQGILNRQLFIEIRKGGKCAPISKKSRNILRLFFKLLAPESRFIGRTPDKVVNPATVGLYH